MGFWNGRVTFTRYRVSGDSPLPFGDELLERIGQHLIGVHGTSAPADGIASGWAGGDHVLDLSIDLGKNVVDDAIHLAMRIDTDKIPSSLLRAYTQIEIDAFAQLNPSGIATKAQRQEAKEIAVKRAQAEAADGRFRRLKQHPVLWDGRTSTLYAGTTSKSVLERLQGLFRETFDRELEPITAGSIAQSLSADPTGDAGLLAASFEGGRFTTSGDAGSPSILAWSGDDQTGLDYLGNEFLVWIWHSLQSAGGTIRLSDGSEASVILAKTLTLDCPRGETGRDQLADDVPTRLPEALRALQAGKLPRRAGMILVRHGAQYELTVQAESFAVSGAALPKPEEGRLSPSEFRVARLESLRHLTESLDLLFAAYVDRRTSNVWPEELGRIRGWLQAA
jgi:recombination associated protein RdgC